MWIADSPHLGTGEAAYALPRSSDPYLLLSIRKRGRPSNWQAAASARKLNLGIPVGREYSSSIGVHCKVPKQKRLAKSNSYVHSKTVL